MSATRARLDELRSSQYAPRTIEAYAADWADFEKWCSGVGRVPLPATPETVSLYLSAQLPGRKVTTLARRVAAIASRHGAAGFPAPTTPAVRAFLSGARRKTRQKPNRKAAITISELLRVCDHLSGEGTLRSIRDRALLLLGFAGAFRRSELASLDLADIDLHTERIGISLGRTKTDQEARGRELVIPRANRAGLCPVRAVTSWIVERGRWPGPLFVDVKGKTGGTLTRERIGGEIVYYALRAAAERAGLDHTKFGAHSLRSGFVTSAADAGADVWDIMATTGHRSVEVLGQYVRRSVARYPLRAVL